jgi:hypothetical protein
MEECFSEPEANVIESSAGFSVRVLGRTGLRYVEGHRSVSIDSEVLAKPRAIAVFRDSIRAWEDSAGPAQLSDGDRDRIASNIKRAFESCGYEIEIHADFDWR